MVGSSIGVYRIGAKLGAGGMGEVYLAHDPRLERRVAVKLLPVHLASDPTARERFRREAIAAAALDHPFICKIFEIGEEAGQLHIVMEYIAGETLESRLSGGPLPTVEALRVAAEIAEALEEAHHHRFVHRDLKPANIMLTTQGRVKVMDFGLAKRFASTLLPGERDATVQSEGQLTHHGMIVGTPNHMSPEQIRGESLDQRSDLFSFGILLCQLLGCPHPFRKPAVAETMAAILREPPVLTGDLPAGLMLIVRRLLAKAPADRYQTMAEVRADLAKVLSAPVVEPHVARRLPVIGREAERAELLRALDRALAGKGALLLLGGEPGIGKTHLTSAVLDEARRRGCFAVTGHCYEGEGAASYMPFIEMLEYSARVAPPDGFRTTLGGDAPEIARLMPELRSRYPDIPAPLDLPPERQRRFLFNAYRNFVERSARLTPIVAVFEDLHWADEPTLQLLLHVTQTASTVPMLLIGTYRDVELDVNRPFADALETLTRQKLASRLSLRRLAPAGVESMLAAMSGHPPPPGLVRAIFDETEGNPFFVEEVYRHLAEEGKLFDERGHWLPSLRVDLLEVPEGVRLVIGKRLKRLRDESRRVLATAAVIGRGFSLALLEALESSRPDAALEAIEEAERAHLVQCVGGGRDPRYQFVHELVRQTLAEGLSLPRRQRLHARIAAVMENAWAASLDKHAQAIAHHLCQAGAAVDSSKTVAFLIRAAHNASRSAAHEDALASLDNALSLLDSDTGASVAELHQLRGDVLRTLGRRAEGVAAYEAACDAFLADGREVRAAAALQRAVMIEGWAGRRSAAVMLARRGLALLGEREPELRGSMMAVLGSMLSTDSRVEEALAVVRELDRLNVEDAAMFIVRAHVHHHAGLMHQAERDSVRACAAAKQSGDPWVEVEAAATRMVTAMYRAGTVSPEDHWVRRRAEEIGNFQAYWMTTIAEAVGMFLRGEFQAAMAAFAESAASAEQIQFDWRYFNYTYLGCVYDALERLEEMEAAFARAGSCAPATDFSIRIAPAALFRALAVRGDRRAWEVLRDPRLQFATPGQHNTSGAYTASALAAEAFAALGRTAESAALLPVLEQALDNGFELNPTGVTRFAAAIAATSAREWSRAEEHCQSAIQLIEQRAFRRFQPDARAAYASLLVARGESAQARVLWSEAIRLYEDLGMPGYARRSRERLAQLQQ
ncbi:MAG: protein kinase [Bryobacterales bacterium]|nr:protein kinase [Bryobacterales bacterium]